MFIHPTGGFLCGIPHIHSLIPCLIAPALGIEEARQGRLAAAHAGLRQGKVHGGWGAHSAHVLQGNRGIFLRTKLMIGASPSQG